MSLLAIALLAASPATSGPEWRCVNEVEIWCDAEHCAATPPSEFTPLGISADPRGGFSVCAYTGCWESQARPKRIAGRSLWMGDNLSFSTAQGGEMAADVTLLIVDRDGVGFVRAGGLAVPLKCTLEPRAVE